MQLARSAAKCAILSLPPVLASIAAASAQPAPNSGSRDSLAAGYQLVLSTWDKNGDARLSQAEWMRMIEATLEHSKGEHDEMIAEGALFFSNADTDHDGQLILAELLAPSLGTFDCMDTNRDGIISADERSSGMARCPAYEPPPSAPPHDGSRD